MSQIAFKIILYKFNELAHLRKIFFSICRQRNSLKQGSKTTNLGSKDGTQKTRTPKTRILKISPLWHTSRNAHLAAFC